MKARLLPLLALVVTGLLLVHGFATPLSAPYTEIASPPYRTQIGAPLPQPSVSPVHSVSGAPTTIPSQSVPVLVAGPTSGTIPVAVAWNPELTPEPTPKPRLITGGIGGQATWWFSFGHGLYAAIRPDLGTKGDLAIVCGGKPYHCLSLPVTTTCACLGRGSDRLIDLSRDAFSSFADPSVGTVRIVLQVVKGGAP